MTRSLGLLVFVSLTATAAAIGSMFMPGPWYASLVKPSWTPPGWLFGPVWTVLYVMIAVAGWLVWRVDRSATALVAWGLQMMLNGAWSYLMFGRNDIGLAFADIVALWIAIAVFVVTAWGVSRAASLLFLPYLAWVSFASALNFAIWRLNA